MNFCLGSSLKEISAAYLGQQEVWLHVLQSMVNVAQKLSRNSKVLKERRDDLIASIGCNLLIHSFGRSSKQLVEIFGQVW